MNKDVFLLTIASVKLYSTVQYYCTVVNIKNNYFLNNKIIPLWTGDNSL